MNIKKILSILLAAAIGLSLVGCNKGKAGAKTEGETQKVVIGVVGEDIEMWPPVVESLKKEGIEIEIKRFDDYVIPNQALNDGDIDLNAFQHKAYLQEEIEAKGYDIVGIGETYISPVNMYSNKITQVSEIKDGDKIAIPNDVTNGGRALKVLESAGLIKLDPEKGYTPEVLDITDNPLNLELIEVDAANIYGLLPDVTAGIINGNYALTHGLDPKEDAVFVEEFSSGDNPYVNVIVARTDEANNEVYQKIVKAYQTQDVIDIYNTEYKGYYLPGWVK